MGRLSIVLLLLLFPTPAHAGLILNDTMTEAANADLDDHTSDSGQTWTLSGASGMRVSGANDNVFVNASGTQRSTSSTDMGTPHIVCEADIAITSDAGTAEAGLYIREASATTFGDHFLIAVYDDTAGAGGAVDMAIGSRVASAEGALTGSVDFNGTVGTPYHVRVQVVGSKVTGCINHTSCATGTSTEVTTGNFVGMYGIAASSQTIDNLKCYSYPRKQTVQ